ncbi:type II toxin-antitoxin system HicB family antitoxin [Flaviaesturariibacter aridisoli]|uniref:Type II toxin-antitoxin system HicB family antitoxin n=1 Tax=Flaviaesturariibacter aridisoli TaxID=2545761 RepID=A0A4R4DY97_9BACT|nr:type II toxin-antitoxin system HicB family antitoxin [Flaviaesturariibacter aridisoli]TCZ70506.1 type II toxin-antitoxin system HicB family antitoxin [Flaviaesturariibacter aridisoli]
MTNLLRYKEFHAEVHFSGTDDLFHGKLIGVDEAVTFQGSSVAALKEAFGVAVENYRAACAQRNQQPGRSYKGSFNVRVPPELHRAAALEAARRGQSLNDFVKEALQRALRP